MTDIHYHEYWMRELVDRTLRVVRATEEKIAPFGCFIIDHNGFKLADGFGTETESNPTGHSELIAIQTAAWRVSKLGDLIGDLAYCTLYSTHEPCAMCCGAINHAKIGTVVWGSSRHDLPEIFRQCMNSVNMRLGDTTNPPQLFGGVCREQCVELLRGWSP